MNWIARDSLLGGIYGRPVVMANFVHAGILTFALISMQLRSLTAAGVVAAALAAGLWVIFGRMLLRAPKSVRRPPEDR